VFSRSAFRASPRLDPCSQEPPSRRSTHKEMSPHGFLSSRVSSAEASGAPTNCSRCASQCNFFPVFMAMLPSSATEVERWPISMSAFGALRDRTHSTKFWACNFVGSSTFSHVRFTFDEGARRGVAGSGKISHPMRSAKIVASVPWNAIPFGWSHSPREL